MRGKTVITVNVGSSSIRLGAFGGDGDAPRRLASSRHRTVGDADEALLRGFLQEPGVGTVTTVAHRIVHGGASFTASCLLDARVEAEIGRLAPLAPLHNPPALDWIQVCRKVLGERTPQVAVFDTAFYTDLPEVAAIYALPRDLSRKHALRRFGFHGLAHQALWRRWRQLQPQLSGGGRGISLQLGAGCSITAVDQGSPRDTSMGFSPLEGLVMATRSGDLDPGLMTYLQRLEGRGPDDMDRLLNQGSGLLGVSGISGDMRVLLDSDHPDARLAVALYCYRARKYVGAYQAVLGGVDAVLFGGGVGENAAPVREQILAGMEWCGIILDENANRTMNGKEGRISAPTSKTEVWVIPVDEAIVLVQEALRVVRSC